MNMVYLLMQEYFEYGDDFYYPAGQHPRKVYTDLSEAQARCAELNAEKWHGINAWEHTGQDVYTSQAEMSATLIEDEREQEGFVAEEPPSTQDLREIAADTTWYWVEHETDPLEDDEEWEPYPQSRLASDTLSVEDALMWEDATLLSEHGAAEQTPPLDNVEATSVDSEPTPATDTPIRDASTTTEQGLSPYPHTYTLESLHRELTTILGAKMGMPWTSLRQWHSWHVPSVTPDEATALSRLFGIAFYKVVEAELE